MFRPYTHSYGVEAVRFTSENIDALTSALEEAEVKDGGKRLVFDDPFDFGLEAYVGEWIVRHHDGHITIHDDANFVKNYLPRD